MCPALCRCGLTMSGHHAHAFVQPRDDVVRRTGLQECHAILAAGRKNAVARLLHFRWEWLAWNGAVTEGETEITRPDLGKSQSGDAEDVLAIGDTLGAFQLYPQQQLAFWIERPGIAAIHVFLGRQAPDRRRRALRSAPARTDVEELAVARYSFRSFHP